MRTFWFVIYNFLGVPALWLIFFVYSVFNSKVKEGFKSRRDLFSKLDESLSHLNENPDDKKKKRVLIHSSSLGEYQQAIPLAEELVKKDYNVMLSFFSPSGYNNSKVNDPNVIKTYLPFDSYFKEKRFLDKTDPEIIVFMRYDLWFNLIYNANKRNIKTVLANARYDENDKTWNIPVISSFKKTLYGMIREIFVIDNYDEENYSKKLSGEDVNIVRIGDSKFERVYQTVKRHSEDDNILPDKISKDKKLFVMGSSWKDDEEIIFPAIEKILEYEKDLLVLLVPHEPKETKITAIEKLIESKYWNIRSIRYSELGQYENENMIIIDKIGILSRLYAKAYLSYVGGGFKTGLHNILEPAIFNMPVLFSNIVKNSDEDEELIKNGCGIVITDTKQFYRVFRKLLSDRKYRDEIGEKCKFVFENKIGVSEKIVDKITKA